MPSKFEESGKKTDFFDLPPVLRQQIYSYLLQTPKTYRYNSPVPYYDFHPQILSVNRQFRKDAGEYLRLYCQFVMLEWKTLPFWLYDDYFKHLPIIRGVPKNMVPTPAMTMTIEGQRRELNNYMYFYAGREALMYVVNGYWKMSVAAKSTDSDKPLLDPLLSLAELRSNHITLTIHHESMSLDWQYDLLGPFLRIHQSRPIELRGQVDPIFHSLFSREFRPESKHVNDDHYIKKFFADFSRAARRFYRHKNYIGAYQSWDTLDAYWLYLNRLTKEDNKFRSIVRYMNSIFASYRLEMYLGCAMAAIHFGDWNRAREAASRPFTREPRVRCNELYRNLIATCRWFALVCEGKIPDIRHSSGYALATCTALGEIRDLMLDLLTAKDSEGRPVLDYVEFRAWNSEIGKEPRPRVAVSSLAQVR